MGAGLTGAGNPGAATQRCVAVFSCGKVNLEPRGEQPILRDCCISDAATRRSRPPTLALLGCAALLIASSPVRAADDLRADPASGATPPAAETFEISEFRVLGNTKLDARAIETAVYPLLGPGRTLATVEQARDALVAAYRAEGLGTVLVDIPEQSVDDGIVRLQVTEGRIEKVRISGARYYSERQILARLPSVQTGGVPRLPQLQTELTALAGEARDREITPTLKPGSSPGTLAVDLAVKDHLPLHAGIEVNNRYTADTTHTRLVGTLSYANMFQRNDTLGLQYQTAPAKPSEVEVAAATYLGRIGYEGLTWSGYAIRSKSDVAAIGTLSVIGNGTILGARLNIPLGSTAQSVQTLSAGGDWKDFGEDIRLPADVSARTPIHYASWAMQYSYARQGEHLELQQQLGVNFGVRGLGANDRQFEYKRAGAHAGFAYLRGATGAVWHAAHGWSAVARLGYQYSEQPLISNEQFALGGVDTVRGYLDAEALVDSGVAAGLEIRAPSLAWRSAIATASVFYDRGVGMMQQPLSSEIAARSVRTDLEGWGAGLHVTIGQSLEAMVDWASPRRKGGRTRGGENRVDFSVKLSF